MIFHELSNSLRETLFYSLGSHRLGTAACSSLQAEHQVCCGWLDCLREEKENAALWKTMTRFGCTGEPGTFLTLNAEKMLPGMHGQTGLVAGWGQCCDVTKEAEDRKPENVNGNQEHFSITTGKIINRNLCSFLRLFSSSWRTFLSCKKSWCFSSCSPWSFSPIFITWCSRRNHRVRSDRFCFRVRSTDC